MLRNSTLLTTLLFAAAAEAQISIGANEMPHAGDELTRTRAFTNPLLDYAATGAGYTWDFSDLAANTQETTVCQTVASTNLVYALTYADIIFNPNRANVARPGVDIVFSALLPIQDPFTFTYRTSSEYKTVGFGVDLAGIPVPIIFDDHDVIYELPLDYGNTSSSFSSWQLSLPSLFHYGYEQDRSNEVDGWGAITTPAGTFDVLRVRTELAGRDTIAVDSLSLGFTIDRPIVREYKWLAENYRIPILQINTTEIFGLEVITDVWFYDEPRSIEVVPPIAALCPGATVDIAYAVTGVFNVGGFLITANEFTAQLSDSAGDFTNAVDIGTVTATTSGTITVTIPPGTPFGTGYRIRVVSSSPAFTGNDNGFDLVIGGAPTAAISAGGSTSFCAGGSVTLNGSGGGDYQWLMDGAEITGATSPDLIVDAVGAYGVIVTTGCGTDTSDVVEVTVNALPEFTLADDSVLTCDGTPVAIAGIDLSGQSPLAYQWYLDGAPLAGEVDSVIEADAAGDYVLEVTNTNTGCVFNTEATNLVVESVPEPVATPDDTTAFCEGGSVILDAGPDPGLAYQWSMDGGELIGETGTTLVVIATGSYTVEVTSVNGCSATSNAVDVTVNPLPPTPVITQSTDTLFTTASGSLQWYVDGVLIPGATDTWLIADSSGDYSVIVMDANGCSNASDPFTYISTGVSPIPGAGVQVVPNPSTGVFTIVSPGGAGRTFEVTDAAGRRVLQGTLWQEVTTLDLNAREDGAYQLRIQDAPGPRVIRLIIAR